MTAASLPNRDRTAVVNACACDASTVSWLESQGHAPKIHRRAPSKRAKVIRRTSAFFVRSSLDKLDFLGSFDDHPQQQHAMAPAPDVGFAPHALLVSHWQVDDLQIVLGGSKQ